MPSEHQEQVKFFDWVRVMQNVDIRFFNIMATPNQAKRSWANGKHMKQEGLSAGFPDISILVPRAKTAGFFIEMKVGKNKMTLNQEIWKQRLESQHYKHELCYSADEAIDKTKKYLGIK